MGQCPALPGDQSSGQTPSDVVKTACAGQPRCWKIPLACSTSKGPSWRPAMSSSDPPMHRH
eukprot:12248829-Prorocentrum_lima.AAC.1